MFLYKIEIELLDQLVYFIVLAETDEKAFGYAESQLQRHFVKTPEIRQASIVEKKRAEKGSGYVLETRQV